jgi:hypothetical protein
VQCCTAVLRVTGKKRKGQGEELETSREEEAKEKEE